MENSALRYLTLSNFSALLLGAVAFQLPIYHLYISLTIAGWVLVTIVLAIVKRQFFKPNFGLLALIGFYGLTAIAFQWSENKDVARFEMEVKMSMAILPFIIMLTRYRLTELKIILYCFFAGIVVGISILTFEALRDFIQTKNLSEFFYVGLSTRVHPSYYSYYLNIGIVVLLLDYMFQKIELFKRRWIYLFLIGVMTIFSVLLLSKNGMIVTGVLAMVLIVYWFFKRKFVLAFSVIVISSLVLTGIVLKSTDVQQRVSEMVTGLSSEDSSDSENYSTGLRIAIWHEAAYLIKKEPFFGYGSGDVSDELMERYDIKGLSVPLIRRLNAHNQYLQTLLAIGLVGLMLLIVALLFPFIRKSELRSYGVMLSLITFVFFLTESVLETQAGVISFVLFYIIFNVVDLKLDPTKVEHG